MIKNNPKISIVMSTYNGSKFIKDSIVSVINQSYKDFEFIIINDCSTDNVEKIIKEFLSKDDRIIYIKNEKNLKLTASLNKGLNLSRGKYIARIDDDDIWMDGKLETQIKFMEKNTDYGLLGTGSIIMDDEGKVLGYLSVKEDDKKIRKNILSGNQFVHSSVLFRKAALKEVGGYYDVKYNGAEDYELWLRMGQKSKFANINEPLIKYRWLETSISRKKWLKQGLLSIKISIVNRNHYSCFFKSFLIRIISTFIPQKIKRYILLKK